MIETFDMFEVTLILIGLLAVTFFWTVAIWLIFQKAYEPGWAVLVPFYGSYVMSKITFGNGWLFFLRFLPIVNLIFSIIMAHRLSIAFEKGVGFTFGLLLLPVIFYPILGFGDSEYGEPF